MRDVLVKGYALGSQLQISSLFSNHPLQAFSVGWRSIRSNTCIATLITLPSYLSYAHFTENTKMLLFGLESGYQIALVAQQTGEQVLTGIGKNNVPCFIISVLSTITAILMNIIHRQNPARHLYCCRTVARISHSWILHQFTFFQKLFIQT